MALPLRLFRAGTGFCGLAFGGFAQKFAAAGLAVFAASFTACTVAATR
eukprot:SAG11_NODE_17167_length_526_cov_0.969555_1_plen_47_part_10